jgi:hypothetical protein
VTSRPSPTAATPRAARRRTLLGVAVLITVLGALLLPGALVGAQGTTGGATSEGDGVGEGGARISLVAQTQWVPPNGEMVLRFATTDIPGTATIAVRIHPKVATRTRFTDSTDGRGLGTPLSGGPAPFTRQAAPLADDGASVQLSVPVARTGPAPAGGVVLNLPGVYPVSITATEGGRELAELVTYLVRIPTTDTVGESLRVGLVVPVDGHLELVDQPDPTAGDDQEAASTAGLELSEPRGPSDALAALASYASLPLTIDAVPAAVGALDTPGTTAASSIDRVAQSLGNRQLLANPYVRLDTGAWVANGLVAQLDGQVDAGARVLGQAFGGAEPDGRTAVLDRTVTPAALSYLHGIGVDRVVVPSDQLDEPNTSDTFLQTFEVDDGDGAALEAAVADVGLTARLVGTQDAVLNAQRTIAELAVLYLEQEGVERGVALVVPPGVDTTTLNLLLTALTRPAAGDGRAIVAPVTLDDLFSETPRATVGQRNRSTTLKLGYEAPAAGTLGGYPDRLRSAEQQVDGFRSLAAPAPEQVVQYDQALLASGAIELDVGQRNAILDWTNQSIDDAGSEVVALPQDYVTLTSQSGQIPLNLENRLPYPVRVRVELRSLKLDFPDGAVQFVELPAAEPYPLEIAVTTRASGSFPMDVAVTSPDGTLQLASSRFTVRSTAISGVGLVLSIGAGAFLLLWWGRHFRKTRRARQLVSSEHPVFAGAPLATDADDGDDDQSGGPVVDRQVASAVPPGVAETPSDASEDVDLRGYARPEPTEPGGSRWP